MAVLGAGAFGQVTLVKRRGEYFALKVLSKAHIVHNGLQARPRRKNSMLPAIFSAYPLYIIKSIPKYPSMMLQIIPSALC